MNERADQAELLLHAAREFACQSLSEFIHARGPQQFEGSRFALGPLHSEQIGIEANVLIHHEVFVQSEPLRHIAEGVLGALRITNYVEAANHRRAGIGRHDPGKQAQGSCLSCPVRAYQAEDFPRAHIKAQRFDSAHAREALAESLGPDRGLERFCHCLDAPAPDSCAAGFAEAKVK